VKQENICDQFHHVVDGVEALAFLRKERTYQNAPRPDLVLLDLNLPKKNGHEVLAEIRSDPKLKSLVVIVVTASCVNSDIVEAYKLNANCYIPKPTDLDGFATIIKAIGKFWFAIGHLPPKPYR